MVEIEQLSERFNGFEQRLDRLGENVSAMAALFYSMSAPQKSEYAWLHPDMINWKQSDVDALVSASVRAWEREHEKPPEREMVCGWETLG